METGLQPAPAYGDLVLLDRLVVNLVDNAVRHNSAGGWIQVASGTRDGQAYLTVTNGGPVIGEDVAPLLFEPFRRLAGPAGSGPGTGLGLSIVRSVALAHHGTAMARSQPAGGLEVAVLLPGAQAEAPGAPPRRLRPVRPSGGKTDPHQASTSSATARSTAAIFFPSRASG